METTGTDEYDSLAGKSDTKLIKSRVNPDAKKIDTRYKSDSKPIQS